MVGTKTDEFGNEVPNCVPVEEASAKRDAVKQLDIPLATETVVHLVYESRTAAEKASEEIGLDGAVHEHEFDGMAVWMPGETHEEFVDTYMDLSEEAGEREITQSAGDTPDTVKGADGRPDGMGSETTDSADGDTAAADAADGDAEGVTGLINEAVADLAAHPEVDKDEAQLRDDIRAALLEEDKADDDMDGDDDEEDDEEEDKAAGDGDGDGADTVALSEADHDELLAELTDKEVSMDTVVDLIAELEGVEAGADEIASALDSLMAGGDGGEGDDGEMEQSTDGADGGADETEKDAGDATPFFEKGGSATGTASKAVTDDSAAAAGGLSYEALADQEAE
jgi:hypothetical protein